MPFRDALELLCTPRAIPIFLGIFIKPHSSTRIIQFRIMIAPIQFRHRGKNIHSLLVFNFAAVRDVIMVVPQTEDHLPDFGNEEKEIGIIFNETGEGVWVCRSAAINQSPDTFLHLKTALLKHFNEERFQFRRRELAAE